MKWLLLITVVLIVAALLLPPWSDQYARYDEINIKTGQARITLYSNFGKKTSETIEETVLSRLIHGEVDATPVEAWHAVNSFSRRRRCSPHYQFHGALSQVKMVEYLFESVDWDEARRREVAEHVLTLWQQDNCYHGVDDYLQELWLVVESESEDNN